MRHGNKSYNIAWISRSGKLKTVSKKERLRLNFFPYNLTRRQNYVTWVYSVCLRYRMYEISFPYWNVLQLHVISLIPRRWKVIHNSTSQHTGDSGASGKSMQEKFRHFQYRFAYAWRQTQTNYQLENKLCMDTYNRNSVPEHIRIGNTLKSARV